VFVEGWAVYAVGVAHPARLRRQPEGRQASLAAITLQQLKMQARMAINAILDVKVPRRKTSPSRRPLT
jgi:hypothetical protein